MKKLFSALFIVMMIALACTMVASATEFAANADGLYTVEYAPEKALTDGTQFGMVVIEATGDEAFALNEATIRYIDQAGAANGKVAFDAFAPMDLKNNGTYKVYIGGGELDAATLLGTLKVAAPEPTPEVKSVTINAPVTTVEEGKTITLTATVDKVGEPDYTVEWSSENPEFATVDANGVVTGVKAGVANITVTAGGKTNTVAITVTAPAVERFPGDADGNNRLTARDATRILQFIANQPGITINESNADVDGNGRLTARDATRILQFIANQPGIELK